MKRKSLEISGDGSERGLTSDRESRKRSVRVGTWFKFGQRKQKEERQSRNLVQIRTQKGERGASESEPGSNSDTESQKEQVRVGTRANFGHRKEKRASQSRNPTSPAINARKTPAAKEKRPWNEFQSLFGQADHGSGGARRIPP
ncbi:hypothetical protein ACOSZF_13890 [Cytobacillus firmus]|uniref:hypothetical protein n=1 Tax=Cytobacillus firmus TaxID=1399 RepID=UPI003B9F089E